MPANELDHKARAARPKHASPVERFLLQPTPRVVECEFEAHGEVSRDVATTLVTHGAAVRGWCYEERKVEDGVIVRYACEHAGRLHHREADQTLDGTPAGDLPRAGRGAWRFRLGPGKELTFLVHGDLAIPLGELGVYLRFTLHDALERIDLAAKPDHARDGERVLLELIEILHQREPDRVHEAFARIWPSDSIAPRDNALIVELWRRRRLGGLFEVVRPVVPLLGDLSDTIWAAD